MAIERKTIEKLEALLEPGELLSGVIIARTGHPYLWVISTFAEAVSNRFRLIVATDRRVIACKRRPSEPNDLLASLPLGTPLGVRHGIFYHRCRAFGETLYILRWQKDLKHVLG